MKAEHHLTAIDFPHDTGPMFLKPSPMPARVRFTVMTIVLFSGSVLPFSISSEERECEKGTATVRLACLNRAYTAADRKLNTLYAELRRQLDTERAGELKEDSKKWIAYKEGLCAMQSEIESQGTDSGQQIAERDCLLGMTRSRLEFLRRAFPVKPSHRRDSGGEYSDGTGGNMTLTFKQGNVYRFRIEVVRGPTVHIGEIEGDVDLRGSAPSATIEPVSEGEPPCIMTFQPRGRSIEITEGEGCRGYHGARAYFDGTYRLLDP